MMADSSLIVGVVKALGEEAAMVVASSLPDFVVVVAALGISWISSSSTELISTLVSLSPFVFVVAVVVGDSSSSTSPSRKSFQFQFLSRC